MKSLARYATTNAVTRTMLSELLKGRDYDNLLRSESLDGAWLALRKTAYGDWITEDPPSDIGGVEKVLREVTASRFKRSIHALRGTPGEVGRVLLSRWDLDNLEFALRLWHGKDASLQKFLTYPTFVEDVPVYDIAEAETLEEIALVLRHTPYFEPVSASLRIYKERQSIFFVEMALERDYYARLLKAVRELGGADALRAEKILGAEIDMLNLSWIMRLMDYYDVKPSGFHQYVISGPSEISRKLAEPGLTDQGLQEIRGQFLGGQFRREGEGLSRLESTALLEAMVREMAVDVARSSLAGYPFSIGCVFAFYLLKRIEAMNLQTVFAGKSIGAESGDISARLHGVR
jgi:V/A-type H+-transporting ATPase subunit C